MARLKKPLRQVPASVADRPKDGTSKIQIMLIVVIILCVIMTVYVNIMSTSVSIMDMHHYGAAVNQAMEDFRLGVGGGSSTGTGSGGMSSAAAPQAGAAIPGKSKIASLSCEIHGGPPAEAAQEMVYWSDVPSDSLYVSPFKHKQKGNPNYRRQYMTFEPDGGGWYVTTCKSIQ